jgi:misacylated tRNA(Ala) deacylase
MTTECLFRDDSYLTSTPATVVSLTEQGGIVLDRTCFYATSGGQPGDTGVLVAPSGELPLGPAIYTDKLKTEIAHMLANGAGTRPALGEQVTLKLDWGPRYRRMRMHTALHLLSAVLPYPVTGGAVNEDDSRLDFDIPDAGLDKDEITAKVNEMIKADAEVRSRWITDAELEANPGLVKTMSVKPPMGTGHVRLIEIVGLDLQPCGGTHVRRTGEIGAIRVTTIEKKGKQNRRVRISFDSPEIS